MDVISMCGVVCWLKLLCWHISIFSSDLHLMCHFWVKYLYSGIGWCSDWIFCHFSISCKLNSWFLPFNMLLTDPAWTEYLFVSSSHPNTKPIRLICNKWVAVFKDYNVGKHTITSCFLNLGKDEMTIYRLRNSERLYADRHRWGDKWQLWWHIIQYYIEHYKCIFS